MIWAASVVAFCSSGNRHFVFSVEADTRDQAIGKAWWIGRKAYPSDKGFHGHHACVALASATIDPGQEFSLVNVD